ncbi:DUF4188 domain-containing protein [Bacillus siamensis]|uniref:DUF4188 domain-containing protein n=1 Tax=Bacillus siamensis TaxID=659243 RepID=UPI002DBF6C77|nr:DUF4188 domain-containing protein [Bacillus siamensis]MEC3656406.1 DUF4188 domain-containing protein [Bacillus siamensis]
MKKQMITASPVTARSDDEAVVFVIGVRINKWHSVYRWLPVVRAMTPMIKELYTNKELGFLSMEMSWTLRSITLIQYWRSFDDLISYARGEKHMKAWRHFYQRAAASQAVGIYHETYTVPAGGYESIYVNMPAFGLAKAKGSAPVTKETRTAAKRMKAAQNQASR